MQSHIGHIQFNVEAANLPFYRDLTAFLGWQTLYDTAEFIGVRPERHEPLVHRLCQAGQQRLQRPRPEPPCLQRAGAGGCRCRGRPHPGVAHLFETPRHRPDFAHGEDTTYYQVMLNRRTVSCSRSSTPVRKTASRPDGLA